MLTSKQAQLTLSLLCPCHLWCQRWLQIVLVISSSGELLQTEWKGATCDRSNISHLCQWENATTLCVLCRFAAERYLFISLKVISLPGRNQMSSLAFWHKSYFIQMQMYFWTTAAISLTSPMTKLMTLCNKYRDLDAKEFNWELNYIKIQLRSILLLTKKKPLLYLLVEVSREIPNE